MPSHGRKKVKVSVFIEMLNAGKATCILLLALFAAACTSLSQKVDSSGSDANNRANKFFNKEEFTGLDSIEDQGKKFLLHYQLDKREGGLITFLNCEDVASSSEEEIVPSQLIYLKTLHVNCRMASEYSAAPRQAKKRWPDELSEALILDMPAIILPELVSLNAISRLGKIKDLEVYVEKRGRFTARLVVDGLDIQIIQLARGDFTSDGLENMILRLDWSVMEAFGRGVDWVMLSRQLPEGEIVVETSSRDNRLSDEAK